MSATRRVGFLGNMNNYPLLLAEGVRALGHQAFVFLLRKDLLHRPESKFSGFASAYPDWVFDYARLLDEDFIFRQKDYINMVSHIRHLELDLVVANDIGLAMVDDIGLRHAAFLTGSDLTYSADFGSIELRTSTWDPAFTRSYAGRAYIRAYTDQIARQRAALLSALTVSYPPRGLVPEGDRVLDSIGVSDDRRHVLNMSDTLNLAATELPAGRALQVLCGSRTQWRPDPATRPTSLDLKGTDILVRGFAAYRRQGGLGELRLARKGPDVAATIDLANELGVANSVAWIDELSLTDYRREVENAHLICDHFATGAPGMVTRDAYAQGRPVLCNLRNEIFSKCLPEPMPGLQASTPDEVCGHLVWADRHRDRLQDLGRRSRLYAEAHLSPQTQAKRLLELTT